MTLSDLLFNYSHCDKNQNEEAEFNKLNFNKITSGIFSEIYSVLNLKLDGIK